MPEAQIYLDFEVEDGYLYLLLWNAGDGAALQPRFKFEPALKGFGQTRVVSNLSLFRRMTYFAPGKRFQLFVDDLGSFFKPFGEKDPLFSISIVYRDERNKPHRKQIVHNLGIYKDLPILIKNT